MLQSLPSLSTMAGNNMTRQIRKKSGTGIYHVMLRGINRQDIFEDDEDCLQTELHSQVNEGLWCGNTPTLSIDRCLLWSYTEIMNKEKMITSFSDPLDTDRGGRRCRTIFLNYHKIPRGRHSLRDFCVNLQYEEKKNT